MDANRFQALAGILPPEPDVDLFDADEIEALAFFATFLDAPESEGEDDPLIPLPPRHSHVLPLAIQAGHLASVATDEPLPLEELPAPVAADEPLPLEELPAPVAADEPLPLEELPAPVAADEPLPLEELPAPVAADEHLDPNNAWVMYLGDETDDEDDEADEEDEADDEEGDEDVDDDEDTAENVCVLEYPWVPKAGSARARGKWSMVRKGGLTGTAKGLAYFTYSLEL